MEKYLCLDLGTVTIGIASSDSLGIVHPKEEYRFEKGNYKAAKNHVFEVAKESQIFKLVVGFPLQIDREEGKRCQSTRRFVEELKNEHPELEIELFDESYSTIEACDRLHNSGYKEDKIKEIIDMYSAVVILEDYLRNKKNG